MTILLLHMAVTWAMVGFIWTIQLVQYPLMSDVGDERWVAYEARHQSAVVAAISVFAPVEVVSAGAVFLAVDDVPRWLSLSAGAVLAAIWVSTAAWYAPVHGRLAAGFDAALHRRLVATNWARTVAWSLRGVAAVVMVAMAAD